MKKIKYILHAIRVSYTIRKPKGLIQINGHFRLVAFDWFLIFLSCTLILTGFLLDLILKDNFWLSRLSAINTVLCITVSFRSLNKHYRKLLQPGIKSWTSKHQVRVDKTALWFMIGGTILWAFGDSLMEFIFIK